MKRTLGIFFVTAFAFTFFGSGCGDVDLCFGRDCGDEDRGTAVTCGGDGWENWNCNGGDPMPGENYPFCHEDWECFPGESCEGGECAWDDDWDDWGGWCERDTDCREGQVCGAWDECHEIVDNCPLTDECLGDPEGYTPEWMGIDPLFSGQATWPGGAARIDMLLDFYPDHIYGEAVVIVDEGGSWPWEMFDLLITGDRDGAALDGQIVERNTFPRTFDATFTATLLSSSEIQGTITLSCDDGEFVIEFHVYRTSPCGCDVPPSCQDHNECPSNCDCVNQTCEPACNAECCEDSHCLSGDQCIDGTCQSPCTCACDCDAGEVCTEGYCQAESF